MRSRHNLLSQGVPRGIRRAMKSNNTDKFRQFMADSGMIAHPQDDDGIKSFLVQAPGPFPLPGPLKDGDLKEAMGLLRGNKAAREWLRNMGDDDIDDDDDDDLRIRHGGDRGGFGQGPLVSAFQGSRNVPLCHVLTFAAGVNVGAGVETRTLDDIKRIPNGGLLFFDSTVEPITGLEVNESAIALPPGGVSQVQANFTAGAFGWDFPENVGIALIGGKVESLTWTATMANRALATVAALFPFPEGFRLPGGHKLSFQIQPL